MRKMGWMLGALGAAALVVPGVAAAHEDRDQAERDRHEGDRYGGERDRDGDRFAGDRDGDGYRERRGGDDKGLKVQAQGGLLTYPGEAASQVTPGGLYGVLVGIEPPIPIFELELGYQGATYQTDGNLTGAQERIMENGGQALLVASPQFGAWEPYVFGGYQISRFDVREEENSTGVVSDATISKAPVGAGVDIHLGDFLIGARGTYNFVLDTDQFANIDDPRSADQVTASLLLGGQF